MKKNLVSAINSMKISSKKEEVTTPNPPTKSPSGIAKSPVPGIATKPPQRPVPTKGKPASSGIPDKNSNSIRNTDTTKAGKADETKIQSKSGKLPERKIEKVETGPATRKAITPSKVVSGKTDVGVKPKPGRDLTLTKPPPPSLPRSSIKTFGGTQKDVIPNKTGKRNDSVNQLRAQQEMAKPKSIFTVANGNVEFQSEEAMEKAMTVYQAGAGGDEAKGCPLEKICEFMEAVMTRNYKKALPLAKQVLEYEPNNVMVNEYLSVLGELVSSDEEEETEESSSEGDSDDSSSSSSEDSSSSDSSSDGSWETGSTSSTEKNAAAKQNKNINGPTPSTSNVAKRWIP